MSKRTPIDEIIRFQVERGLDQNEYEPVNEHSSIVEELLESMGMDVDKADRPLLKTAWRHFFTSIKFVKRAKVLTKDMIVDAYCDVIVFAVGAIMKLGYDPRLALGECAKEINSREGSMVDGKFEKDLSDEAKAKWYTANYDICKG